MSPKPNRARFVLPAVPRARSVQWITVKSLLTARALERADAGEYLFCGSRACDVVYFTDSADGAAFLRVDVRVPVFPKEPPGERLTSTDSTPSNFTIATRTAWAQTTQSIPRIS